MSRPASAPFGKPMGTKVRQAVAHEPYLTALRDMKTLQHHAVSTPNLHVSAAVLATKRQVHDFIDQEPSPPRVATTSITSTKVPLPYAPAPMDGSNDAGMPQTEHHILSMAPHPTTRQVAGGAGKLRPKSSLGTSPHKRATSGADSPLVKHPMRLVAAKLMASLTEHTSNQPGNQTSTQSNQTNQHDGKTSHAYFQDIFWQVAGQLEQQPPTAGLAQVLKHIWTTHVDSLHSDVEKSKRLGLTFAKADAGEDRGGDIARTPIKRERRNSACRPLNRLTKRASTVDSKSSAKDTGSTSNDRHANSTAKSTSVVDPDMRRSRRRSQTALTFDHVDQVREIQKILSAKVKALRLELISMQRLRESIFATVLSADAARQKDIDTRMRLRITAQLEQTLQKRYSVVSESMQQAAVQIQRMARGKLAGKRIRFARIVALMHMSKELFRQKLQKREWCEFDCAPDEVPIEQLEEELKVIVWEVTRLVRDLSLDWWKLSLSEERARLTWELSDAKDDLRHLQQQSSVLMQNVSFAMSVVSEPVLTRAHEARLGVHQYYSPSPRAPDSTKDMMDSLAAVNSKLEDFIFSVAKTKRTRTAVATQTDSTLQKQPTYLQALAKLASVQDAAMTSPLIDTETPDDGPCSTLRTLDSPLPPQTYSIEPAVQLVATTAPGAAEGAATPPTTSAMTPPTTESAKSAKRSPHRAAKAAASTPTVPGLKDVPSLLAKEFKIVGKTQPHKPKIMCVAQLKLLLHEVYAARAADELRSPVGEFLYRFFALKYGLRNVAEMYLVNFVASVKKYNKHDPEIRLCARLCHFKHTEPLSLDAFDYYVGLLVGLGIHRHEAAIPLWFLPHLVRQAVDLTQKYEPGCMLELVHYDPDASYKAIESKLAKLPPAATDHEIGFSAASLTYIDRDDALAICLDAFEAIEVAIHNHLLQAFQAADIDKNGVLCFAEFNSLVQKVYSTPEAHVHRMFFDAISLTGHPHRDAILPEVFVLVAKKEGLSRKSYVSERRDAITPPLDASLLQGAPSPRPLDHRPESCK